MKEGQSQDPNLIRVMWLTFESYPTCVLIQM